MRNKLEIEKGYVEGFMMCTLVGGWGMYFSGGYIPYKILDVHIIYMYMYSVYIHIFCQKNNTPLFAILLFAPTSLIPR